MQGFTDMHTHLLPGVDDGATDISNAMALIRMAWENGTKAIMLTPHYRGRFKKNTPAYLKEQYQSLCDAVAKELPDVQLYLGHEVHYEMDAPELLLEGAVLTLNGSDYVLLEFRTGSLRSQIVHAVSEMVRCGFVPIIAHMERYDAFRNDSSLVEEVLDMGALLQLNADSVMGKHGFRLKWFCHKQLKAENIHFIASDAHDTEKRPPLLRECFQQVQKKYGEEYATRVFYENAQAVIENRML